VAINIADLLAYAEQQLGKPYVFATAGPNTFDCSGLVKNVFGKFGVSLPHHSEDQATYGTAVDKTKIQPGDLVFSDWGDGPNSHVGIAVTPHKIIDAPQPGQNVQYDNLTSGYLSKVTSVRRLTSFTGKAPTTPGGAASGAGSSLTSQFEGALNSLTQVFTGPYQELAKPLQDIGSAAAEMASIGDKALKLFLPTNMIRVVCGILGIILILAGIFMLSKEARGT
jgi:hypothetical protein